MTSPQNQRDEQPADPASRSSGNQGARGSRGQANDGALPDDGSHDGRDKPAPGGTSPDLRDDDAQGGGGAGSNSSRSS
jgi:hypothetical protein